MSLKLMHRRNFVRGLGAALALPGFASRPAPARAALTAAPTPTGVPLRTAFIYFPNGAIPSRWWPEGDETNFNLPPTLAPLESLRSQIQILQGLDQNNATPGDDGGGDHARGNSVFLTGVRIKKSATQLRAGISIDQVMAKQLGHLTRFPSLELGCENSRRSGECDSGYSCAYQYNVSWQSSATPMPAESHPRLVFERLFGTGAHGERAANSIQRMKERRSVLDFVMNETHRLRGKLDGSDKDKLDQYLTGVRDVETRIEKSERFGPNVDPMQPTPQSVPESHGDYIDLMLDLLLLAFETDSTRIATFAMAYDGNNRSFAAIGTSEGHHDLSHHQNDPERMQKVATIDKWYVQRLARFLDRMQSTKDVDGQSLLHNARVLYGSGNADGNRHTHSNLPLVLAGAGGGQLKTGRFVKHGGKPLSNLFLTLAHQAGVPQLNAFGDATGPLTNV